VTGALALHSCTAGGFAARCGTLMVPEDRLSGAGPEIPIRVVVIPATGPDRQPDPIVWFEGGPGTSAVDVINEQMPFFTLNTSRDVVFIDQRGTGASALTCPAFPGFGDKAALGAAVQSCLAHLKANLRFYTTAMFADDVGEVLSDLHYGKVDVVGDSYGATSAQVFLLRHPDRARTMTLLSGTLLDVPSSSGSRRTPNKPSTTCFPNATNNVLATPPSLTSVRTGPLCGPRSTRHRGSCRPSSRRRASSWW
jgi:pimeloyl-ACP methyl ester carboxylesterase